MYLIILMNQLAVEEALQARRKLRPHVTSFSGTDKEANGK